MCACDLQMFGTVGVVKCVLTVAIWKAHWVGSIESVQDKTIQFY